MTKENKIQSSNASLTMQIISLICSEPYRVFFPLGVLMGIVGVSHWLFFGMGWIKSYSTHFHSSIQIQAYMSSFVIGFLLTAMPRFSQTETASFKEFISFLILILGIFGFQVFGNVALANLCFVLLLLFLARFAFIRFRKRKTLYPPIEFVWIPMAIFHGILGALIIIGGQLKWLSGESIGVGKLLAEQGFLLSIVIGVGGFLGPRLMGVYQLIRQSKISFKEQEFGISGPRIQTHLALGVLLFFSFWLEGFGYRTLGYGLRAFVVSSEFLWPGSITRLPRVPDFFARLLWISFWMVTIGYWAVLLFPTFRVVMLHLVFIGGYSLMTFSVATMVVLSHGGEASRLHHPLLVLWIVAIGLLVAVVLRVASVFFPNFYFNVLAIASASWVVAGISWLCFVAPRILRVPHEGEFEKSHEKAMKRVLEDNKC